MCSLPGNSSFATAAQVEVHLADVQSVVGSDMEFLGVKNKKRILVRTVVVSAERASAVVALG